MADKSRVPNVLMVVAVACAVVTTGLVVRRELFLPSTAGPRAIRDVEDWQKYLTHGRVVGDSQAPVKIIEFVDFQCPFCRTFALETWPALQQEFKDQVVLVVRHWPLSGHRHAKSAARAAECAAAQGRFEEFHNLLFEQQDSIGGKPFSRFAAESRVSDLKAFEACASDTRPIDAIDLTSQAANEIGFSGTPSALVNNKALNFVSVEGVRARILEVLKAAK